MFEALSNASKSIDEHIDDIDLEYVTYKIRPTKSGKEKNISIGDPIFIDYNGQLEKTTDPYSKYSDFLSNIYSLEMIKEQLEKEFDAISNDPNLVKEKERRDSYDTLVREDIVKGLVKTTKQGATSNFCNRWKFCGIVEQTSTDFMKVLNIKAKVSGVANIKKKYVKDSTPGDILAATAIRNNTLIKKSDGTSEKVTTDLIVDFTYGNRDVDIVDKLRKSSTAKSVDLYCNIVYIGKVGHMIKKRLYSAFENRNEGDTFAQIFLG